MALNLLESNATSALKLVINPIVLHALTLCVAAGLCLRLFWGIEIIPAWEQYGFLLVVIVGSLQVAYMVRSDESSLSKWRRKNSAKRALKNLTPLEKRILLSLIETGTAPIDAHIGADVRLEKLGVIYRCSPMLAGGLPYRECYQYNIADWVWEYLLKNPALLEEREFPATNSN